MERDRERDGERETERLSNGFFLRNVIYGQQLQTNTRLFAVRRGGVWRTEQVGKSRDKDADRSALDGKYHCSVWLKVKSCRLCRGQRLRQARVENEIKLKAASEGHSPQLSHPGICTLSHV